MILNDHKVSYFSYFQKKGYFNSSQSEGFPKKEELKSSLGTMSHFQKTLFSYLGPMKGELLNSFMILNS